MTDDKVQPGVSGQPERAKLEQASPQTHQRQADTAGQPNRRVAPGRKPLFRN